MKVSIFFTVQNMSTFGITFSAGVDFTHTHT